MKNLGQITEDMRFESKLKTHWFNPVIALGINSNIKVIEDQFFKNKDDAFDFAANLIEQNTKLYCGFRAQIAGVCHVSVKTKSGYSDGPFERKVESSIVYQL